MRGTLLVFSLPPDTPLSVHRQFRKRFYGEETSCAGGRYRYRRRGFLDDVPHVKLYTGVIIVRKESAERVRKEVLAYGAQCIEREIILTDDDKRMLAERLGDGMVKKRAAKPR